MNNPVEAHEHLTFYREMMTFKAQQKSIATGPELFEKNEPLPATPSGESLPLGPLGQDIVVVSGLPRSGTPMLMQMLDAGGMPILADRLREPDQDNPKGYFELETVKKLNTDKSCIGDARAMALKIVTPLVNKIPPGNSYRIILIERDFREILESQAKMIARRGEPVEDSPARRGRLMAEYGRVIERTRQTLSRRSDVKVLFLRFEDVVHKPALAANRINRFVGGHLDETRMAVVVEPSLYRNRERPELAATLPDAL